RNAALLMIRRHGKAAAVKAGFRAAQLQEQGDLSAAAIWIDIINQINKIHAAERAAYNLPVEPVVELADDLDSAFVA
ncbi:MAG TPA: hypothetical protein VMF53_16120, partial [Alphaproteobacteria bacterium]|nr:hypothetical protein [Alphaproteobacteria bacterium]